MYRPLAPRSWAYTGSRGTTIPTPVIEANIEKKEPQKLFYLAFSSNIYPFEIRLHTTPCIYEQEIFEQ